MPQSAQALKEERDDLAQQLEQVKLEKTMGAALAETQARGVWHLVWVARAASARHISCWDVLCRRQLALLVSTAVGVQFPHLRCLLQNLLGSAAAAPSRRMQMQPCLP